ncbi:PadR family transcriptional regulator [Streptomyces sp. 150FB]|uniref:PadR family transcriptional regulator n=1 Tax=Streptomyces sp. 150FB TaxID=1576605 RepID=UPI00058959FB|nr:PadR family transcriptional regulator [Streptomyces sp. 150FB]KIF76658.1 PadR family transcriptional regulator [Streptomyces sp. 150FB]
MAPVFAHGRLRLYLLGLLDEAPRHGYEVIRLLEERFNGLYAPSAGTVYPRLAKLEAEGLVTHATSGGRKVYSITEAGRAELAERTGELADLELEIRESVSELAAEIRDDVRGAAGHLRSEMRAAASESLASPPSGDSEAWKVAKEELRHAKQEWQEQARRAKDESRRAREDAQQARRQAQEAQQTAREEMQRMAKQVQDQVLGHFGRGDWPTGVGQGLSDLVSQLGGLAKGSAWPPYAKPEQAREQGKQREQEQAKERSKAREQEPADASSWARDIPATGDPARDLERLLDRFRDDVRDAARDHGVSAGQLTDARKHLSTAATRITTLFERKD